MLSKEDLAREIGKNIFIYPMDHVRILGGSVDLTASEFAWTSDGENIYDIKSGLITVPAGKTACIITNEAIYVKENIGGTYHSRVTLAMKGFTHISTTLDPLFHGQSLIAMTNTTTKPLVINAKEHERIVTIVFHYLKTPIHAISHKPNPAHADKLKGYDGIDRYTNWVEKNQWAVVPSEMTSIFYSSGANKAFQERKKADEDARQSQEKNRLKKIGRFFKRNILKYIIIIVAFIGLVFISKRVIGIDQEGMPGLIEAFGGGALITMLATDLNEKFRK